jgi:hypothetical protein
MGSIFDDLGPTVDSAVSSLGNVVTSVEDAAGSAISSIEHGLASGLSSITSGISSLLSGIGGVQLSGVQLPLPNPLFNYATYNYVIGIASLPDKWLNDPDNTYRKGLRAPLICKSASIDPSNRVKTPYGAFEFYIDDVKIQTQIGQEEGANTNSVGNISFKIIEPYSMGLLIIALQTAAQQNGHGNWNESPFLLTIDFRGNKETGTLELISNCSRQIPFKFTNFNMKVNEQGAVYDCEAMVYNQSALLDANTKFKTDVSIAGRTVQEVLQTGDKSLQTVINQKLKEIAIVNKIAKPDQILILFPKALATNKGDASSSTTDTSDQTQNSPTVNSSSGSVAVDQAILTKLSVSPGPNANYIQDATSLNAIGRSPMGFDETRKGDVSMSPDNKAYNTKTQTINRSATPVNPQFSDLRFSKETDILNAISQTIIQSTYITQTLDPARITPEGYRGWWNIDVQTYTNGEVNEATGQKPKLFVYRVCEYLVHASSGPNAPNIKPPGYDQLKKQAVKQYNYIYTGKNVDILKFDITYNANFRNLMPPDAGKKTTDIRNPGSDGADGKDSSGNLLPKGQQPSTIPGVMSTAVSFVKTLFKSDKLGGGGAETEATRAARAFNDSLTKGTDMITLEMEIIGDPYFIMQSAAGNYTAQPTQYCNLNADGSINHQSGEVDILVNFRTPVDINQSTGLYDFGKNSSSPVQMFSGLYMVRVLTNSFSHNEFKQTLQLQRRPLQEAPGPGSTNGMLTAGTVDPSSSSTPSNTPTAASAEAPTNIQDTNGNPIGNNGWGEG